MGHLNPSEEQEEARREESLGNLRQQGSAL